MRMDPNETLPNPQYPSSQADMAKRTHLITKPLDSPCTRKRTPAQMPPSRSQQLPNVLRTCARHIWETVKCVFRSIKGIEDVRLAFGDGGNDLQSFVHAQGASEHRTMILGYVPMVEDCGRRRQRQRMWTQLKRRCGYVASHLQSQNQRIDMVTRNKAKRSRMRWISAPIEGLCAHGG